MLPAAAAILCLIAMAHSYLGETHILQPLFAEPQPGPLSHPAVRKLIRWVWHWMSIGMLGFAALLLVLKGSSFEHGFVLASIALWAFTACICLYCAGPTHPGFIGFSLVVIILLAQRMLA